MSSASDRFNERVAAATKRLAALKARQLMREIREANSARQRARRQEMRRRLELGGAVLAAGCGEFTVVEVIGLLLDSRDRVEASPTMRLALRKRGQEWFASLGPSGHVDPTAPTEERRDVAPDTSSIPGRPAMVSQQ